MRKQENMRKKRVLWVNEASFLATGYSTYGKEVMTRMHNSGKYEIAELACYSVPNDERAKDIPWRVYPNLPTNDEQNEVYNSDNKNAFGKWQFENVCLDFKPDVVLDIRDFWMWNFESSSPFRKFFRHILMPTVDSEPQAPEWLYEIAKADKVLTYQDWSLEYLSKMNGINNLVESAPSAANPDFVPQDKTQIKQMIGLDKDIKIVGTLMRNQMRKLYPQLFQDFKKFLNKTKRDDVYLFCHTSYPDLNCWDIPALLNEYELSSKVLFSYRCENCGNLKIGPYQDINAFCGKCGQDSLCFPSVHNGIPTEALAKIYNIMDVYVQYACAEGLGMPQLEAAACGVPVMATNYSGMEDIVKKLDGYPINYTTSKEMATGCLRAIPNSGDFVNKLINFFNMTDEQRKKKSIETRANFEKHYHSWDKIAEIWMKVIDEVDFPELPWNHPARIKQPPQKPAEGMSDTEFARWLIKDVLQDPEEVNGFIETDIIEKLNFKIPNKKGIDRQQAFDGISNKVNFWNTWEELRVKRIIGS